VRDPAQAAGRAGHSVAILLKIYARCLDGQDAIAERRVEDALGDRMKPVTAVGSRTSENAITHWCCD
jgi:hypothetical protein